MHTRSRSRSFVRAFLALSALAAVLAIGRPAYATTPTIIYVVPGGAGAKTGADWANANDLAPALAAVTATDTAPAQIWVAQGTYKPTTTSSDPRSATFGLKNNVAVYGGFTSGQTLLSQRNPNPATNLTVLSGDIGTPNDNSDNSYHVVTGSGTDSRAILDGFTVSGGNANNSDLPATYNGGGMYNSGGSPALTNVVFSGNYALYGGGVYNTNSSSPTLTNVVFSGNSASSSGGGMYSSGGSPTLTNVVFSGNFGGLSGGGGMGNYQSSPTLTNVTFSGNSTSYLGGGMYSASSSSPKIRNSIFWGDTPDEINGGSLSSTSVSNSIVKDGYAGAINSNPMFQAPPGNLRLQYASPAINKGDNNVATPALPATDLDGNPRVVGDQVDMGAYESPCPGSEPGSIIYVNGSASGSNNGTSWTNAYTTLTAALAGVSTSTNTCPEIWVAQGTYKPTTDTDRTKSFALKSNVAVYGGFAGTEAKTEFGKRNWRTNVTTLSGNIGRPNDSSDNSYHVVVGSGTNYSAILDGFTVSGGYGDAGACYDTACGGGMFNDGGSPTLTNLTISGNYALYGGGMHNRNGSSPTLTNVTISGNAVDPRFGFGGGMYNYGNSSPTLTNVTFSGNYSLYPGGGIANDGGSNPTIRNSILWGDGSEIADLGGSTTVVYSIVQGLSTGMGNLNANPLFVTPITASAPTTTGNLRLQANSPAIDKGNNAFIQTTVTTDLDNAPRIVFGTVDMGAYEAQIKASPTQSPAANAAGWNNTDVTVTWNWSNAGGPISASADCLATSTSSGEGTLTVTGTCKDSANNTGFASYVVKVDKTKPTATITSPADGAVYLQGAPLTASFSCADPAGSGVASCVGTVSNGTSSSTVANGSPISTATVGAYSFTVTATDNAGNTSSQTVHYVVGYTVTYVSPLLAPPSVNNLYPTSIGTTSTPVRWTLKNAAGAPITAAGTVTDIRYKPMSCSNFTTDPSGALSAARTSTNPKYDTYQKAWVYNWLLPARGCYTLFITLNTGQVLTLFYHIY